MSVNWFVAGFCTMAAIHQAGKGDAWGALLDALFVVANVVVAIKLAPRKVSA